jgi:hypothetical protein
MSAFIVKFFWAGQDIPEWLEKQEPVSAHQRDWQPAILRFASPCFVFNLDGGYRIVPFPFFRVGLHIKPKGLPLVIVGQSPPGGDKGVIWYGTFSHAVRQGLRKRVVKAG